MAMAVDQVAKRSGRQPGLSAESRALLGLLDRCRGCDRRRLRRRVFGLGPSPDLAKLQLVKAAIEASMESRRARLEHLPKPTFDASLPVAGRRDEIAAAIRDHQVVIICGETGSGKTTQIPKICLELGRGVDGLIGQTQPRRIAARATAARIAEELGDRVGGHVGYKIRFSDQTRDETYIKVMTDGILLAETQGDRLFDAYDTIIIDEAHERSLNIDFLIGYLKRILPKRPDLKVILTSATIDPERFSAFFDRAPIVMVEGRTYPVEVWYRPAGYEADDEEEEAPRRGRGKERARDARDLGTHDPVRAVVRAVDEISEITNSGDVLVFLSGEREIRETAKALRHHHPRGTEVLPLFARLSAKEQQRVFERHTNRRIVLATNVAETSLTVPGIEYVIDTGLARISRYSGRSRVQRLPIEPISQASANQRKGRCGRVGPGVCVRLYSEEDFEARPEFPEPEIVRSHLASVILQMKALGLGDVERFEFLDRPTNRMIKDGYETLAELGAVDDQRSLTDTGRKLARLPIDPRLGRMILEADREECMQEMLVIASALAVQDPRERRTDSAQAADAAHKEFADDDSDFLAYLNLWNAYREVEQHLSRNKLSKWCSSRHLSYLRMRDWHDTHRQVKTLARESGLRFNEKEAAYEAVHRAILAGLLSRIGQRKERIEYKGAQQVTFYLHPSSVLKSSPPPWVVASELVETTRLYARGLAKVDPAWIERVGSHLAKYSYSNVRWDEGIGHTVADEKVSLLGLAIVEGRRRSYDRIDPAESRALFIREGLVEGRMRLRAAFLEHNRKMQTDVDALQAKQRTRSLAITGDEIAMWYDARLPVHVCSVPSLKRWLAKASDKDKAKLMLTKQDLMREQLDADALRWFPDSMTVERLEVPLAYAHEPGQSEDGLTATVPIEAVGGLSAKTFSWLVPGLLEEKVLALIKSLPKGLRTNFLPAAEVAGRCASVLAKVGEDTRRRTSLEEALAAELSRLSGISIGADAFDTSRLPMHLTMNIKVVDRSGKAIAKGRELAALQDKLQSKASASLQSASAQRLSQTGLRRWDFGPLKESVLIESGGGKIPAYPALVDAKDSVTLTLLDSPTKATLETRRGLRRLYAIAAKDEIAYHLERSGDLNALAVAYATLGSSKELRDQLALFVAQKVFVDGRDPVRDADAFEANLNQGWANIAPAAGEVFELARIVLRARQGALLSIEAARTPAARSAANEEGEHVDRLVGPTFLTSVDPKWLAQMPRYMAAVSKRIERAGSAKVDAQVVKAVATFEKWHADRRQRDERAGIENPELETFRWMIEELRVSLFAQELGTIMSVSPQRLEKQWSRVEAWRSVD